MLNTKIFVANILHSLLKILPLRNIIVFESSPDFNDSTLQIYNELKSRGFGKKYKFVWFTHNKYKGKEYNVPKNSLRRTIIHYTAKCIICGNGIIYKVRKNQFSFYLTHGGPTKETRDYYYFRNEMSYLITISPFFVPYSARDFRFDISKTIGLGQPRIAELLNSKVDLKSIFGNFDKFIFWYPTFKNSTFGKIAGNGLPLPFSDKKENFNQINEFAKKNNILIIIKLHPAQIHSDITSWGFSNIFFLNNDFLKQNNLSSYGCLAKADALITDYSSVFHDYLVCNKPICFIWDDFDLYNANNGLNEVFTKITSQCGAKVYTLNELCNFIENIQLGKDENKEKRAKVFSIFYPFEELNPTKRVTDFIVEKASLKIAK